jgi:glucan biosynthesis protein C
MERSDSLEPGNQARRDDNDWLTVLAMLCVFSFHCARFFNYQDWHVKNNQLSEGMTLYVGILVQWIMPLFFVLSGVSSYYSLKSRESSRYVRNRLQRLVIPLVFGIFVFLVPVQVWIERSSHGQFDGTFIQFYPHYFEGFYAFGGNFAWMGLHLWYLEMLFVFTLLTLPLFVFLEKARIRELMSRAAAFFAENGAIFLFGIPLFLMELLVNLQPKGFGMRAFGGWSPFSYLVFFVTGFLMAFDSRYRGALERSRLISLVLGFFTTGLIFVCRFDFTMLGDFGYTVKVFTRSFNSWFWLVAILGFGSKYLSFSNEVLKYAREAVLPFYILHQTVIVIIGFYIASWETSVMVKYATLSTLSFAIIIAVYDLLIKRVKVLRFLFGMNVKK